MMKSKTSTCFENLPNELIYGIFDFMDGLDLYQTFYDLNSRINNILNSTSNMHLEPDSSIATSDSLVERFAQRVVHIRFYDYLPQQQLEQIRPECFAHLVYLRMCYIDDSVVASTFFQRIFSNEFPSLHKCVLDELTPPDSSQQWLGSPSLRSLSARGFALPLYSYILNSCSNLTHLHWSTIRCADVDNEATLVRHTHLKRLYIRTINIQIIETILFHVPNLKRLYIVSDWSRGTKSLPLD
ncbi:unnamed protein product, partial [Rotaria magnacalcarata]